MGKARYKPRTILVRLLILSPLYILWVAGFFTIIAPWVYWCVTGMSYDEIKYRISELEGVIANKFRK